MKKETVVLGYEIYGSINELQEEDAHLLRKAQEACKLSYAPYSRFYVGTAGRLQNGKIVPGSNQENASFPVGICSERVLLAALSSQYPGIPLTALAISYRSDLMASDHPVSPCGLCRQSLQEYEERMHHPVRLILGGMEGNIYVLPNVSMLLPLSFTPSDLQAGGNVLTGADQLPGT